MCEYTRNLHTKFPHQITTASRQALDAINVLKSYSKWLILKLKTFFAIFIDILSLTVAYRGRKGTMMGAGCKCVFFKFVLLCVHGLSDLLSDLLSNLFKTEISSDHLKITLFVVK